MFFKFSCGRSAVRLKYPFGTAVGHTRSQLASAHDQLYIISILCEMLMKPLLERFHLFDEWSPIRQKSAKFSIVRKLCQPDLLVCVVVSLYVIVVIVFMTCT